MRNSGSSVSAIDMTAYNNINLESNSGDIKLTTGSGYVQFASNYTSSGGGALTGGYITVKDPTGSTIKLGIIS